MIGRSPKPPAGPSEGELAAGPVGPAERASATGTARRIVDPRGRAKVYRPLPADAREASVAAGLAAYARGAYYLAHEELEPAWMAAEDPGERERLAGLIKLAAAFVHAARGNPPGVTTNLRGARERLARANAGGADGGIDLATLLAAIDDRLARVAALPAPRPSVGPAVTDVGIASDLPHEVAGPRGRVRRPPLDLDAPPISWRTRA